MKNIVHKRNNFRRRYCQEYKVRQWMSGWWSCKSCYGLTSDYVFLSAALWRKVHKVENSSTILLMILFRVFSICLYLCICVSVYAPPPSPLPGATLERDTICLQTPHWAHSGAALTTHFLPCLWHINCSLLYCTMCIVLWRRSVLTLILMPLTGNTLTGGLSCGMNR